MADELVHKQEFNIRELSTQAVTLYPASAHVVRDIPDVELKVIISTQILAFLIQMTNNL